MLKKLHILQIISTLAVTQPLSSIVIGMHNFIAKFRNILEICKKFAENQVNEKGNVPRRALFPPFPTWKWSLCPSQPRLSVWIARIICSIV